MKRFLLLIILITVACSPVSGRTSTKIEPIPSNEFVPVPLPAKVQEAKVTAKPTAKATPRATPRPTRKPVVKPKIRTLQGTSHSGILISGKASWYCSVQIPICHHSYGPGSMVAAACAPLRAVYPNWRGKTVVVTSGGRSVVVKLVDWCGSKSKVIDLYREPMRRLGGSGVLPVKIYRR